MTYNIYLEKYIFSQDSGVVWVLETSKIQRGKIYWNLFLSLLNLFFKVLWVVKPVVLPLPLQIFQKKDEKSGIIVFSCCDKSPISKFGVRDHWCVKLHLSLICPLQWLSISGLDILYIDWEKTLSRLLNFSLHSHPTFLNT